MLNNFSKGIIYFLTGFPLIIKPGIRPFAFIPLLLNILLFAGLVYYSWLHFDTLMTFIQSRLPTGIASIVWSVLLLAIIILLIILFFIFTLVANLIADPFNERLAAAVETYLTGVALPATPWYQIITGLLLKLASAIRKLFYYLFWGIILAILTLIPPITLIAPLIWFGFGAWTAALQYTNYSMDNHSLSLRQQRRLLANKRSIALGFGSMVVLVMMIPVLNLLVMPVAVAGATRMWVEEFAPMKLMNNRLVHN